MNAIVLDIETIPDARVWTPPAPKEMPDMTKCSECKLDLAPAEEKVRKCTAMSRGKCRFPKPVEAEEEKFPPLYAHQVVVLGFCVLTDGVPTALQAWTTNDRERELLYGFSQALAGYQDAPTIVTWNGASFDLPVIELRSLRHGVPLVWYDVKYRGYGEGLNLDLQRVFGGARGQDRYISLDTAAKLIGLPGKPEGLDGSMVRKLVEIGQFNTVSNYCKSDVVQTTYLYLRYRLLRGYIDLDKYKAACAALKGLWEQDPGFGDFKTDDGILLL